MFSKSVHFPIDDHHPTSSTVSVASSTDILREILLCLPVKSLLVFKIVSKRWLSLISDPHFVSDHSLKNPPKTMGFFLDKFSFLIPKLEFISLDKCMNSSSPFKSLSFVNDPAGIKVEQSCNGLLCCSSFRANNTKRIYYVYNPSTTHYMALPLSPSRVIDASVPVCSVSLAFNPLKSPHYKAICILNTDTDTYRIEIYSSKTASWKVSGYANSGCEDLFSKSGVFWNGSLHWISLKETSHYVDTILKRRMCLRESSMVLDIDREVMRTLPIPSIRDRRGDKRRIGYFGECNGHMHLIEISSIEPTRFNIFEMRTDSSAWNVKYRVHLDRVIVTLYPEIYPDIFKSSHNDVLDPFPFHVLLVDVDGGSSSSLILRISNNIVSYNLKEKNFEKIRVLTRNHDSKGIVRNIWLDVYQYIGTLIHV